MAEFFLDIILIKSVEIMLFFRAIKVCNRGTGNKLPVAHLD